MTRTKRDFGTGLTLFGDIRPQEFRHRLDTPTLRGVNVQRLFGSQRALKTVEDFTEFEQRAAYFDGDPVIATKEGVNTLDRASQVRAMAEFQKILDFPPAPKLGIDGKLNPKLATTSEMRGQGLFFGKANRASCHVAPYYTDNLMHNLRTERFFKPQMINGRMANSDGPIKTFSLRGIPARYQGLSALSARWPPADSRRHSGVFQPGARNQTDREREEISCRIPAPTLNAFTPAGLALLSSDLTNLSRSIF